MPNDPSPGAIPAAQTKSHSIPELDLSIGPVDEAADSAAVAAECLGWVRDLAVAYPEWLQLNYGPLPTFGYSDGHIPFDRDTGQTTKEYQALYHAQWAAHQKKIADAQARVASLRRQIANVADRLMDVAAAPAVGVDYSKFRELVESEIPAEPLCTGAKNALDLLVRRLRKLAQGGRPPDRDGHAPQPGRVRRFLSALSRLIAALEDAPPGREFEPVADWCKPVLAELAQAAAAFGWAAPAEYHDFIDMVQEATDGDRSNTYFCYRGPGSPNSKTILLKGYRLDGDRWVALGLGATGFTPEQKLDVLRVLRMWRLYAQDTAAPLDVPPPVTGPSAASDFRQEVAREVDRAIGGMAGKKPRDVWLKRYLDENPNASLRKIAKAAKRAGHRMASTNINNILVRETWIGHPSRRKARKPKTTDPQVMAQTLPDRPKKKR